MTDKPRKTKSRTGCKRCKEKRRRCDETKPSCSECLRRGLTCPGYPKQPLKWRYVFNEEIQASNDHDEPALQGQAEPTELDARGGSDTPSGGQENHDNTALLVDPLEAEDFGINIPSLDLILDLEPSRNPNQVPSLDEDAAIQTEKSCPDNLSVLQRLTSTNLQSFLVDMPVTLVQYYFDYVCPVWSSFDSPINPFRTTIGRFWSRSAPIYFAIQSMAAASLANDFPSMRAVGIQMQQQAYACLKEQLRRWSSQTDDGETFFALLMVGSTTAWHNGGDLGIPYLKAARNFIARQKHLHNLQNSDFSKNYPFFKQCLLYWNMVTAFVIDDEPEMFNLDETASPEADLCLYFINGQTIPHPWTGPFQRILGLFYHTAKLVRATRPTFSGSVGNLDLFLHDMGNLFMNESKHRQEAQKLEEELIFLDLSSSSSSVPTGDENTPSSHFTILSEAYRCVALLQIYHVFPDILISRFCLTDANPFNSPAQNNVPSSFAFLSAKAFEPSSPSVKDIRRSLALHASSLLEQLPVSSGTRSMQPVLLAATAGDLVFSAGSQFGVAANTLGKFDAVDVKVAQARRSLKKRLFDLMHILPKSPVERIFEIVSRTWSRADSCSEAFWMDIMIECNLETLMC